MSEFGKCKNCGRTFQKCTNKTSWRCTFCSPECFKYYMQYDSGEIVVKSEIKKNKKPKSDEINETEY